MNLLNPKIGLLDPHPYKRNQFLTNCVANVDLLADWGCTASPAYGLGSVLEYLLKISGIAKGCERGR